MASFDVPSVVKLLLIGDTEVGKSCITLKFADNTFSSTYINTIGVEFKNLTIQIDGQHVMIRIWDTGGDERFRTIVTAYYRGSAGLMVVYDVTKETSFNNIKQWMTTIEEYAPKAEVMVIGNKCDVDSELRMVSTDRGKLLAEEYGAMFMEVSAKTGENIKRAFTTLAQEILRKWQKSD